MRGSSIYYSRPCTCANTKGHTNTRNHPHQKLDKNYTHKGHVCTTTNNYSQLCSQFSSNTLSSFISFSTSPLSSRRPDPHQCFLAYKLAENGTLRDYMNIRVHLPEQEARFIFSKLCAGLSYCHSLGITH